MQFWYIPLFVHYYYFWITTKICFCIFLVVAVVGWGGDHKKTVYDACDHQRCADYINLLNQVLYFRYVPVQEW